MQTRVISPNDHSDLEIEIANSHIELWPLSEMRSNFQKSKENHRQKAGLAWLTQARETLIKFSRKVFFKLFISSRPKRKSGRRPPNFEFRDRELKNIFDSKKNENVLPTGYKP